MNTANETKDAMVFVPELNQESDGEILFATRRNPPKVVAVGRVRHGAVATGSALNGNALPVAAMVTKEMFTEES